MGTMHDRSGPDPAAGGFTARRGRRGSAPKAVVSSVGLTRSVKLAFLLLAVGALLFVGIRSRVSHRLPIEKTQELLASDGDPVKFLVPEQGVADGTRAAAPSYRDDKDHLLREDNGSVSYAGRALRSGTLLRAPPSSL